MTGALEVTGAPSACEQGEQVFRWNAVEVSGLLRPGCLLDAQVELLGRQLGVDTWSSGGIVREDLG